VAVEKVNLLRLADMKGLVQDVFANSKYKYFESLTTNENGYRPDGNTSNCVTTTKAIDTES
jgi:hypothetical protein